MDKIYMWPNGSWCFEEDLETVERSYGSNDDYIITTYANRLVTASYFGVTELNYIGD